jgi:hypothetical protein
VTKRRRPRKPRDNRPQTVEAEQPDEAKRAREAEAAKRAREAEAAKRAREAEAAKRAREAEAAKGRQTEHDKRTWAADLATGLVAVLAVVSSIITLIAAPPHVGVIVGLATLAAGVFVGLTRLWARSRRVQRSLGLALAIVGLAVTGVGVYGLHEQKVVQQSAILTDTCAAARNLEDAWNAASVAQFTNYTSPQVSQTEKRLFDAVIALDAAANKSGSAQAAHLASGLEITLTREASSSIFDPTNFWANVKATTMMGSLYTLCEHSLRPMSKSNQRTTSWDFCDAARQLIDLGTSINTRKQYHAFQRGFAHFMLVSSALGPGDLQDIGLVIGVDIMAAENVQKYSPYQLRVLTTGLYMAKAPCKAIHVSLGHRELPHFAVSRPKDGQGSTFVKVGSSLKDCHPTEVYGINPIITDLQCVNWSRQLQVFKAAINCGSWFATHVSSSWRYVCGPRWVVRASNVADEIIVAAETGGLPQPLSITRQSAGPA